MAKDDVTPETVSAKPSKTSPQYARSLRNIMLLERVLEERNKRYQRDLKIYLSSKKKLHPDLTNADQVKLEEHFTKNFYGPEYSAMAEFSKLDEKRLVLLEKENELAKKGNALSKGESEQLAILNMQVEMGPEAYATQRLFDADTVKKIKREYPEIEKNLSDEIKEMSKNGFENHNPATRHMPATVALFNKKYPGLNSELNSMKASKDPQRSMLGACAMGMLKTGSVMLNPTGFFVSKAVSGILQTKAMAPLRENAAIGISRVVNKTGMGEWFKRQCSKVPKNTLKNVALGASVATSVALVGLGVVELEDAYKIKDSALAFVESIDMKQVSEDFNNAIDSTRDYFSNPDELLAGPDSVKDYSMIDSLSAEPEQNPGIINGDVPTSEYNVGTNAPPVEPTVENAETAPEKTAVENAEATPDKPAVENAEANPEKPAVENAEPSPVDPSSKNVDVSEKELFPKSYTVESGDTLSEIVEERLQAAGVPYNYGLISDYVELVAANSDISDPNVIMVGQDLDLGTLPAPSEIMSPEQLQEAKNNIDVDPGMESYSPALKEAIGGPQSIDGKFTINYQPEQYIAPHVDVQNENSYSPRRMS
jgi:LysM repeat protein